MIDGMGVRTAKTWQKRTLAVVGLGVALWLGDNIRAWALPYVEPPVQVAEWKLAATPECGKTLPPEAKSWSGVAKARRVCRAQYTGPVPVQVLLFDMPELPGSSPFDAFQKWHPESGTFAFYKPRCFGIVESTAADDATLQRFAEALQPHSDGRH